MSMQGSSTRTSAARTLLSYFISDFVYRMSPARVPYNMHHILYTLYFTCGWQMGGSNTANLLLACIMHWYSELLMLYFVLCNSANVHCEAERPSTLYVREVSLIFDIWHLIFYKLTPRTVHFKRNRHCCGNTNCRGQTFQPTTTDAIFPLPVPRKTPPVRYSLSPREVASIAVVCLASRVW